MDAGLGAQLRATVHGTARSYYEQRGSRAENELLQAESGNVYVGNLSFYTREEQIWEVFSKCGPIKRIIMGLNRNDKTPCGFCFVEYHEHEAAVLAADVLTGARLDDRLIRVELDVPFEPGRQWGRGKSGGQVRDEFREQYDPGRGGFGPRSQAAVSSVPLTEHGFAPEGQQQGDVDEPDLKRPRFGEETFG
jgi:nuclear cap-binding protein subunit 2